MKHKTEINPDFEMPDDPLATKFHRWAFPSTIILAYLIAVGCSIVLVILSDRIMR